LKIIDGFWKLKCCSCAKLHSLHYYSFSISFHKRNRIYEICSKNFRCNSFQRVLFLSLCLSVSLSLCLSVSLSLCLSVFLPFSLSFFQAIKNKVRLLIWPWKIILIFMLIAALASHTWKGFQIYSFRRAVQFCESAWLPKYFFFFKYSHERQFNTCFATFTSDNWNSQKIEKT